MRTNFTLKLTLRLIALVQIVLGLAFLLAPDLTAAALSFAKAPAWTNWLFGMMAARFLGYGYGMLLAANQPWQARSWISSMIGVQAIDWLVTLLYLWRGDVTLAQVTTASFLPVIFIAVLWVHFPRGTAAATPPARL